MSRTGKLLIVDDDPSERDTLAELVREWGHRADTAFDGASALRMAAEIHPQVIITDLVMPNMDGMVLLKSLRDANPETVVVILTGQGSVDLAVDAIRQGAYDFIEKPLDTQKLRLVLERALEKHSTQREVNVLKSRLRQQGPGSDFIGQSATMRQVFTLIERVAPSKASVVITGQSGTGKEVVARAVHNLSPRKDKPFVAINCSAIPANLIESEIFGYEKGAFTGADQRRLGCFELADKGTLFLDEIGELPFELQAKFLRVLEEERLRRLGGKSEVDVDVRVLCATNRDLKEEVKAGRFREDLYFRLNVFHIQLPPLKDRTEDIPLLISYFVERFNQESGRKIRGVSPEAQQIMTRYAWPGNIRELRNAVERAVILCDGEYINREHLPPDMAGRLEEPSVFRMPLGKPLDDIEKAYILGNLRQNNGNKARTAEILGISEKTLYNKLKKYREDEQRALSTGAPPDLALSEALEAGR
ncbi:MAG: sigma-54-dependent transcriptional regulator [Myxococcales bacterium]